MSESLYGRETSPPIAEWFVPGIIPWGGAPDHIKAQWIEVALPIREGSRSSGEVDILDVSKPSSFITLSAGETVPIRTLDGIKALTLAGRQEAAHWWKSWYLREMQLKAHFITENNPRVLLFQSREGDIYLPSGILEIFSEAQRFDELEPIT